MPLSTQMIMLLFAIVAVTILFVFVIGKIGALKKWDTATLVRRETVVLFVIYIVALFVVTVIAREKREDHLDQWIPFADIILIVKNGYPWYVDNFIVLDVINVLLFIPYGLLAGEVLRLKRTKQLLPIASGIALSVVIEVVQFITKKGVFDVNDIIYNTLGTLIGCGLCVLFKWIWRKAAKPN